MNMPNMSDSSAEENDDNGMIGSIGVDDSSSESDVEMHEEVAIMTEEQKTRLAQMKKEEGNEYYKNKAYPEALQYYTEAIELCPTCAAFYGNRSATYIMLANFQKALEDARRAVQLEPEFIKGHLREAKCHLAMGEAAAAVSSYEKVLQLDSNSNSAKSELTQAKAVQQYLHKAEESFCKGDYRTVVFCLDRSIDIAPGCNHFKTWKAECFVLLKRYQESQEIVNNLLRSDNMNADAIYVRGLCLYHQDNIDKAFQHFQQVLRLAPDHKKARDIYRKAKQLLQKKEDGNQAFRQNRLAEALQLYTDALLIDKTNVFTNAKLHCNRAAVLAKQQNYEEAIKECSKAIELDDSYIRAYQRRAKCYTDAEQYEEAVRDYEKLFKIDRNNENRRLLQEAKLELKKSKRKDYYKLLGVAKNATEDEIKKAYRKRALLHHPDRHSNATDEAKKKEEVKFKEIGEAYSILSDQKKKMRYDSGQDIEDEGMAGFHDVDPNQIFQAFFGGGAPRGGFGGFGGPGQQQGGGFPGGFSFQFG